MTDRELLILAADAAYLPVIQKELVTSRIAEFKCIKHTKRNVLWLDGKEWNPLTNDGDALRLAVKLGVNIDIGVNPVGFTATAVIADYNSVFVDEYHNEDAMEATRRAIVRAAAEIGRAM